MSSSEGTSSGEDDEIYDEVSLSDMDFESCGPGEKSDDPSQGNETAGTALSGGNFYYPCPCGDRFVISLDDLEDCEDIAYCPSCSLKIRVTYDPEELAAYRSNT